MIGSGLVASFIGHEPGRALFVGLYSIRACRPLTYEEYWKIPEHVEMKALGMKGWSRDKYGGTSHLWFNLERTDFYTSWQGKLIVGWPPPERSWWRRAHRNQIPVAAILEDSALAASMPNWNEVEFTWAQLGVLPTRWRSELSQWRGIYYIFDVSDRKGYVGSAYGESNLFGRLLNYAAHGHGGNSLLRGRDAQNLRFTILQRVSPDMDAAAIVRLESSWKQRLHTRQPYGLNDN